MDPSFGFKGIEICWRQTKQMYTAKLITVKRKTNQRRFGDFFIVLDENIIYMKDKQLSTVLKCERNIATAIGLTSFLVHYPGFHIQTDADRTSFH